MTAITAMYPVYRFLCLRDLQWAMNFGIPDMIVKLVLALLVIIFFFSHVISGPPARILIILAVLILLIFAWRLFVMFITRD